MVVVVLDRTVQECTYLKGKHGNRCHMRGRYCAVAIQARAIQPRGFESAAFSYGIGLNGLIR